MAVIDTSYFQGPLAIANLSQPAVSGVVETYIELHGNELLSKALGNSLAIAYQDGIAADDPEERWTVLKDGLTFQDASGHTHKWVGFDKGEALPINPVAAYVWFHYNRDNMTQMSGTGSVQAQAENAGIVSPSMRMSTVWNQMAKDIQTLWVYLNTNISDYPELVGGEVNYGSFRKINGFGI